MSKNKLPVLYTIPSTRRPQNVENMMRYTDEWVWIVKDKKDLKDYRAAGATNVTRQTADGLSGARNTSLAMAEANDMVCLQVDDDLRGLYMATGNTTGDRIPMNIDQAVLEIFTAMLDVGTGLGGALSTANPFFHRPVVNTWKFCCGQFLMIDPAYGEKWDPDPAIRFKDDWEMTCRFLRNTGKVARVDWILPDASHTGSGGLNQHRTSHNDMASAKVVMRMYPEIVRRHPTRVGELQLIHTKTTMPKSAKEAFKRVNGTR